MVLKVCPYFSPDSKEFILTELDSTYASLGEYFDLEYVPYGNADIDYDTQTVRCQHGEAECSGNSFEQCAIAIYDYDADKYLPYASCLASKPVDVLEEGDMAYKSCAEKTSLDWSLIKSCHDDEDISWTLQMSAAENTPSYVTYVPWVEVNGEVIDWFEGESLSEAICMAYPENEQPDPCLVALAQ